MPTSNTPLPAAKRIKSGIYCKKPCEQCGTIHNRKRFCSVECKTAWFQSCGDNTKPHYNSKRIEFVISNSGCWEVVSHAPNCSTGYPQVVVNGKNLSAHRYVYQEFVDGIPAGMVIRHTCDNRRCINPDHLQTGTLADNAADCVERGRSLRGERNNWAKLTEAQVLEIFHSQGAPTETAKRFCVTHKAVWSIRNGVTWSWLTGGKK